MSHDRFRFGLVAATFGVSLLFFVRLPALVSPRGPILMPYFGRIATSFTLPAAALAIVLIFKSLAKRDPFRANYAKFRRTYDLFLDFAVLLAVATHVLILSKIMIVQGHVGRWITYVPTALIGVTLIVIGNVWPRLRPNSAMGIRTRWALRDETVWMKTHRAGGYFLVVFGLILIAWTFIDFQGIWWVLGPGAVLTVAGLPALSYVIWKRQHRSASPLSGGRADRKEMP
ncbi:MAG: SdpI family protein [Candidatus Aminicenantales bacterium]